MPLDSPPPTRPTPATVIGHLLILRVDHWTKNIFVLPGIVLAWFAQPETLTEVRILPMFLGLLATCLVSSSNYVLNEVLDAPHDRFHPTKRHRPVPSGRVNIPLAYVQWIALAAIGFALGATVSGRFVWALAALWAMGIAYNTPPIRTKELPHLDVISESVNNPIRLLIGWFLTPVMAWPSLLLLMSYWMLGAYYMALKRLAERRAFSDADKIVTYRTSFRYYTEERLLTALTFYASSATLCFGAFSAASRPQLALSFPLIAWVLAISLSLGFVPDSPLQQPEFLFRERRLLVPAVLCALLLLFLLFVDLPVLS